MTSLELDNTLRRNNWLTDSYPGEDGYVLPEKFQYALALSVDNNSDAQHDPQCPYWIADKIERKRKQQRKRFTSSTLLDVTNPSGNSLKTILRTVKKSRHALN